LNHADKAWLEWAYSQNNDKPIMDVEDYVHRELFAKRADSAKREAEAVRAVTNWNAVRGIQLREFEEEFYAGVFPVTEFNRSRELLIHDADKSYNDVRELPGFFVRYHCPPKINVPGRKDVICFSYPRMQEEASRNGGKLRKVFPVFSSIEKPNMSSSVKILHETPKLAVAGLIRSAIRQYLDGTVF
jgi:hypothetical protein